MGAESLRGLKRRFRVSNPDATTSPQQQRYLPLELRARIALVVDVVADSLAGWQRIPRHDLPHRCQDEINQRPRWLFGYVVIGQFGPIEVIEPDSEQAVI